MVSPTRGGAAKQAANITIALTLVAAIPTVDTVAV
jgi:hypothetical protein